MLIHNANKQLIFLTGNKRLICTVVFPSKKNTVVFHYC